MDVGDPGSQTPRAADLISSAGDAVLQLRMASGIVHGHRYRSRRAPWHVRMWLQLQRAAFAILTEREQLDYAVLYGFNPVWHRDLTPLLQDSTTAWDPHAWWRRRLDQIDGLTVHHAASHSPEEVHAWEISTRGRPGIEYHLWINETGEILLTRDLESGCWHDHAGDHNTHLSVVLAGFKHQRVPPPLQIDALGRVAAWAIRCPRMRVVRENVRGHNEYHPTECPGWDSAGWRPRFEQLVDRYLQEGFTADYYSYGIAP